MANAETPIEIIDRHTATLGWREEDPSVARSLALIGQRGGVAEIPTPAAVVDLDIAVSNIQTMHDRLTKHGVAERPHAKTHKTAAFAELQQWFGAVGNCCAKLGEAEALSAAGIDHLLITSPVVNPSTQGRLAALLVDAPGTTLVVSHPTHVELLQELLCVPELAETQVGVVLDVDVGLGRSGVVTVEQALAVVEACRRRKHVRFVGVQAYGGHWQHQPGATARHDAVAAGMVFLTNIIDAIESSGTAVDLRTGGGTGTVEADLALGVLNELQPGSYVFMDDQYRNALADDLDGRFRPALSIHAQVTSAYQRKWVTTDAGLKAFATDAGNPTIVGRPGDLYGFYGDEQGMVHGPSAKSLQLHDRLQMLAPHCDPTIDRYDVLHIAQGDTLVGLVPVNARGRSR